MDHLTPVNASIIVLYVIYIFSGNNEIDFDEFLTMMAKKIQSLSGEDEIKEAFKGLRICCI